MVKLTAMEYDGTNDWKMIPGCTRFMASPHVHHYNNKIYQVINTNYRGKGYIKPIYDYKAETSEYYSVAIERYGKFKVCRVNRVIAETFIANDNPSEKTVVNHIDEVKTNNDVSNLEWCTIKYNTNYGHSQQKIRQAGIDNGEYKPVSAMNIKTGEIISYETLLDCGNALGIDDTSVGDALYGIKRVSAKGYVFVKGKSNNPKDFEDAIKLYNKRHNLAKGNGGKRVIINDRFIFSSQIEAAKFLSVCSKTVYTYLNKGKNNIHGNKVCYYKGGTN